MTALDLIKQKRDELEQRLEQAQADLYAMQGALQVLEELEKELRNENQVSD